MAASIVALLPSLLLIIGSAAIAVSPLRWRRGALLAVTGLTTAAALAIWVAIPTEFSIHVWRPLELFGEAFAFELTPTSWALIVFGAGVLLADSVSALQRPGQLIYAALSLAALAVGNVLTAALLWSLLVVVETVWRLREADGNSISLRTTLLQTTAIIALVAGVPELILVAALLRTSAGSRTTQPFTVAVLAPLSGIAVLHLADEPGFWIGVAGLAVAVLRSFVVPGDFRNLGLASASGAALAGSASLVGGAAGLMTVQALLLAAAGPVSTIAALPLGLAGSSLPTAAISTAGIAITAQELPAHSIPRPRQFIVIGLLAGLVISGLAGSGWTLALTGAGGTALGLLIALLTFRWLPSQRARIESLQSAIDGPLERTIRIGLQALTAVRTVTSVLEGDSAVLWILLTLIVIIVGVGS